MEGRHQTDSRSEPSSLNLTDDKASYNLDGYFSPFANDTSDDSLTVFLTVF